MSFIDEADLAALLPDLIADALRTKDTRPVAPSDHITKTSGVVESIDGFIALVQLDDDQPGHLTPVQMAAQVAVGDRPVILASPNGGMVIVGNGGLSGSGHGGGGFLTITSVKTADYVAAVEEFVPVDLTSASVLVTLPASPDQDSRVGVKVVTTGTGTLTVQAGGLDTYNVAGGLTSVTLDTVNDGFIAQYSSGVWYILGEDLQTGLLYLVPTAVQVNTYAAAPGDFVPCDTTAVPFTVTLPTTPATGSFVGASLVTQDSARTNHVAVVCGGTDLLDNGSTTLSLATVGERVLLEYAAGTWSIINRDSVGHAIAPTVPTIIGVLADLPGDIATASPDNQTIQRAVDTDLTVPVKFGQIALSPTSAADWAVIEAPQKGPTGLTSSEFLAAWQQTAYTPIFTIHPLGGPATVTTGIADLTQIGSSVTSIAVTDTSTYPASGHVAIGSPGAVDPIVKYTSKNPTHFLGCTLDNAGAGTNGSGGASPGAIAIGAHVSATVEDVAAGAYDAHYVALANSFKAAGFTNVIVRMWSEMNLPLGYSSQRYTTGPSFVAAWQRIVDAMRGVGGITFKYVWAPAHSGSYNAQFGFSLGPWVPWGNDGNGDPYFDYCGMDIYDQDVTNAIYGGSMSVSDQRIAVWRNLLHGLSSLPDSRKYGLDWLATFAANNSRPIIFSEWGLWSDASHGGGDNPDFIHRFSTWLKASTRVVAACYQQDHGGFPWLSETHNPLAWAEFAAQWLNGGGGDDTAGNPTPLFGSQSNPAPGQTSLDGSLLGVGPILSLRNNPPGNGGTADGALLGIYGFGGYVNGTDTDDLTAYIAGYAREDFTATANGSGLSFWAAKRGAAEAQQIGDWNTQGLEIDTPFNQTAAAIERQGTPLNLPVDQIIDTGSNTSGFAPYWLLGKAPRARVELEGKVFFKQNNALYGAPPAFQHATQYSNAPWALLATAIADVTTLIGTQSITVDSTAGWASAGTIYAYNASFAPVTITYTGTGGGQFLNCTTVSGTGTIAANSQLRGAAINTTIIPGQGFLNVPFVEAGSPTRFPTPGDVGGIDNRPGFFNVWAIGQWDGPVFGASITDDRANSGILANIQHTSYASFSFLTSGTHAALRYGYLYSDAGNVLTRANGAVTDVTTAFTGTQDFVVDSTSGINVGVLGYGQVTVETNATIGYAVIRFTSKSGTTFHNCTCVAGTGDIANNAWVSSEGITDVQVALPLGNLGLDGVTLGALDSAKVNYGLKMKVSDSGPTEQYGIYIDAPGGLAATWPNTKIGIQNNARLIQGGPAWIAGDTLFGPGAVDFSAATVTGLNQGPFDGADVPGAAYIQRHNTFGAVPVAVNSAEPLGFLGFRGYDGAQYGLGAWIIATVSEPAGYSGSPNHWGTRLEFGTTPIGSGGIPTTALRLGSNQLATFYGGVTSGVLTEVPSDSGFPFGTQFGMPITQPIFDFSIVPQSGSGSGTHYAYTRALIVGNLAIRDPQAGPADFPEPYRTNSNHTIFSVTDRLGLPVWWSTNFTGTYSNDNLGMVNAPGGSYIESQIGFLMRDGHFGNFVRSIYSLNFGYYQANQAWDTPSFWDTVWPVGPSTTGGWYNGVTGTRVSNGSVLDTNTGLWIAQLSRSLISTPLVGSGGYAWASQPGATSTAGGLATSGRFYVPPEHGAGIATLGAFGDCANTGLRFDNIHGTGTTVFVQGGFDIAALDPFGNFVPEIAQISAGYGNLGYSTARWQTLYAKTLNASGNIGFNGKSPQAQHGWAKASPNTISRTAFNPATISTPNLAEKVAGLISDLVDNGVI